MTEEETKNHSENQLTVQEAELGLTFLLDSSFILALLNPRDPNHKPASGVFGFICPYNCRFHIPLYVFAEVISKKIQEEKIVSSAFKKLENFLKQINNAGILITGINPNLDEIISRYKKVARKKIRFLQSNDFIIATEGILSKSIILTCDHGMYEKVKKYYSDIYYVASHSAKYKDDISKVTKKVLQLTKKP